MKQLSTVSPLGGLRILECSSFFYPILLEGGSKNNEKEKNSSEKRKGAINKPALVFGNSKRKQHVRASSEPGRRRGHQVDFNRTVLYNLDWFQSGDSQKRCAGVFGLYLRNRYEFHSPSIRGCIVLLARKSPLFVSLILPCSSATQLCEWVDSQPFSALLTLNRWSINNRFNFSLNQFQENIASPART